MLKSTNKNTHTHTHTKHITFKKVGRCTTAYTIVEKGELDPWGYPIEGFLISKAIITIFMIRGTFVETMELEKV